MATFVSRKGPGGRKVWQARVRREGYPQQIRTFDTKSEAKAWAGEIEAEMRAGRFLDQRPAMKVTVGQLLSRYVQEVTPAKRGSRNEVSHARVIHSDSIAQMSLQACTVQAMSAYRDRRLAAVSAATVNRELNLVSHVFTVAAADWGLPLPHGNPVTLMRRPKVAGGARDRRLTGDEEARLIQAARFAEAQPGAAPIASIILFALATGMRRGEIVSMDWRHVDLASRVLLVPDTKIGESRRIPLSRSACTVLDALSGDRIGPVWGHIQPASISRAFAHACRRAGIPDLRFHDLRHEATSRLFEKGLNPMEVASITGHKTLQMLRRYTHLRAEDLVAKLD